MTKLGTAFHETFRLSRSTLSQILQVIAQHQTSPNTTSPLTLDDFKNQTTLGNNQIKSGRRYAYGAGLVDEDEKLTLFGSLCIERDPGLAHPDSQWVIHYHLAVPHKSGPVFWNSIFSSALPTEISRAQIAEQIKNLDSGALAASTYLAAATIFTGTYSEDDSLGNLGFLNELSSGQYLVADPKPVSPGAFACILADYWENVWGQRGDVLLTEVTQGPLSRLLRAEGVLADLLKNLAKEQELVRLQRRVPPHQVIRLWSDSALVWRTQLYS